MNFTKNQNKMEKLQSLDIDIAKFGDKEFVSPNIGGCWICNKMSDNMEFDLSFDTYYHEKCLEKTGFNSILEFERKF